MLGYAYQDLLRVLKLARWQQVADGKDYREQMLQRYGREEHACVDLSQQVSSQQMHNT